MATGGDHDHIHNELGEHRATLRAQEKTITDLRDEVKRNRRDVVKAIVALAQSQAELARVNGRNVLIAKVIAYTIVGMIILYAWLSTHSPDILKEFVKWLVPSPLTKS